MGIVVARPSSGFHRSWLPVWRARRKPSLVAARRNSSERALGMDDFGRIAWHWSSALAVLLLDHPEDFSQFCQSLLCCWHQGVAPGNGRNLRHPSVGLVSIKHDLVIIEAHVPSFYAWAGDSIRRIADRPPTSTASSAAAIAPTG